MGPPGTTWKAGSTDLIIGSWGPCPSVGDRAHDLDGDGAVGAGDLLLVLQARR
jgi:hypothetical protein